MNYSKPFRKDKFTYILVVTLVLILGTLTTALGMQSNAIVVHASSAPSGLFEARSRGVDLTSDDFSVTHSSAITVLTHGLGGSASHWSNNNENIAANEGFGFAFDDRSLIERLREKCGANVFLARMKADGSDFHLYRVPVMESRYQQYILMQSQTISQLSLGDINQHMIIVFEETPEGDRSGTNEIMYKKFSTMLNAVVTDFGFLTGGIYPRINLIGHSRGGLTNMEYAIKHPRLISDIYSIGTPFNGSNFGRVNLFADMITGGIDSMEGTALYDINNITKQNQLKNGWTTIRENGRGSHIRFFPMAGTSTVGLIADVGGAWGTIGSNLLGTKGPFEFPTVVTMASTIIWGIEASKDYPQTSWTTINDTFYDAFSGWAWLWVGRSTGINDDLLVHRDSQKASGYTGITDTFEKRFDNGISGSEENYDKSRVSARAYPIVHNLEVRDEEFIGWIVERINTDFNFSMFSTTTHQNGVTINGFDDGFIPSENFYLDIPETLWENGIEYPVVAIAPSAFANQTQLYQLAIPSSLTTIGNNAFRGSGLVTISFENGSTLQSIGVSAFENCESLGLGRGIALPASLGTIGNNAFRNCSSLAKVVFATGSSLKNIGEYVFYNNAELEEIQIPASVESIDQGAFSNCSKLRSVNFDNGSRLETIGNTAFFHCTSMRKINIPASVKRIGDSAFMGSTALTSLTFESDSQLNSIEHFAFSGCASLGSTMQDSIVIPVGVTSIGAYAFSSCTNAYSISIPNSVASIGNYAFSNCLNLSTFYIPNSVTTMGNGVFASWKASQAIHVIGYLSKPGGWDSSWNYGSNAEILWNTSVVHNGIFTFRYIDNYSAFEISLRDNVLSDDIPSTLNIPASHLGYPVRRIADRGFTFGVIDVNIPESIQIIGQEAFYYSLDLISISFLGTSQLSTIKDFAFFYTSLTNITIPASVTSIGDFAFSGCDKLTNIAVESGNNYYWFNDNVLFNKAQTILISCIPSKTGTYTIPSGVTTINRSAFYGCDSLTNIIIPASVTDIGDFAFSSCSQLANISVAIGNSYYSSNGGVLFNKNQTQLIHYPQKKAGAYVVPNGVTDILERAFWGCYSLTSIHIPSSLNRLADYAFYSCSNMISITFDSNCSITSIGEFTFSNCFKLTSILIPNSVLSLGRFAFNSCVSLESVSLSNNLLSIADNAFENCQALQSIIIPDTVIYLGEAVFAMCRRLVSATLPSSITIIPDSLFYYCASLKEVTMSVNVTSIGNSAFIGCSELLSFTISKTLVVIGNLAFDSCNNLTLYTEWESRANGWSNTWNDSNRPVVWGCELSADKSYVVSFTKGIGSISNTDKTLSEPYRDGFDFLGWNTEADGMGISYSLTNAPNSTKVYAIWFKEVNCLGVEANGLDGNITTTQIILEFNEDPSSAFTLANISLTGATAVSLAGSANIRVLTISNITVANGGNITLQLINSNLLAFIGSPKSVTVYVAPVVLQSLTANGEDSLITSTEIVLTFDTNPIYFSLSNIVLTGAKALSLTGSGNTRILTIGNIAVDNGEYIKIELIDTSIRSFAYGVNYVQIYVKTDGLDYSLIYGNQYEISAIDSSIGGILTIPATYNGKPVTRIADYAFYNCGNILGVVFEQGSSVTTIGDYAFYGCVNLSSITLPSSVTTVGTYAFANNTQLTSILIPSNVTSVGGSAFYGCRNLEAVTFQTGESLLEISDFMFYACTSLTSITLPSGIANIGEWAFYGCNKLTTVTAQGNNLAKIGDYAFMGCTKLEGIRFSSVEEVGIYAFAYCHSLESVSMPNLDLIDSNAFYNCYNLVTFDAKNITYIEDFAFYNCNNITTLIFSNAVTYIGTSAFYGWEDNQRIYLIAHSAPNSTWSESWNIGSNALIVWNVVPKGLIFTLINDGTAYEVSGGGTLGTRSATGPIYIPAYYNGLPVTRIATGAFALIGASGEIIIPNTVTSIGGFAFFRCAAKVVVPSSVIEVEYNAFVGVGTSVSWFYNPELPISKFGGYLKNVFMPEGYELQADETIEFINFGGSVATTYFYSKVEPIVSGNYWHYVDGLATPW